MTDEIGSRRLPPATDKRGGYPGSGDGPTMPPPPPNPSGSPPPRHDAEPVHPVWGYGPAHGDLNVTYTGRFLDPVRAAALHEAVQHEAHRMRPPPDDEAIGRVIAAAKMFEAWLEGPERFDAYLAEDETP